MTGRKSLHYCYDVSYQCWLASEEARIYCNNFSSSNAVVCSRLVLEYTVRLAIINAVELERNGCFSLSLLRNVVLCLRRTSINRIANRISCQIWYKGCLKGTFGRGVQICEGVSKSVLTRPSLFCALEVSVIDLQKEIKCRRIIKTIVFLPIC